MSTSLWRHANFLKFWISDTISLFGSQITGLALPFAAATTLGATPGEMGVLGAVEFLPFILVGLFAGVWADRVRRGPILMWANIGRGLLLATIPLTALFGALSMGQLYVVGFCVGVLTVFFDVAYQAYLPALVNRDHLVEGNSKLEVSRSLAQVTGPGIAGALVQLMTAPLAILIDSLSFFVSSAILHFVRAPETPIERPEGSIWQDIGEGLGVVLKSKVLRSIAFCTGTSNLFSSIWGAVFLLFMTRQLGLDALQIGIVFGLGSIGALAGALLASKFAAMLGLGPTIIYSMVLGGVATLVVPFVAGPVPLVIGVLAGAQMLTSVGTVVYNVNQVSLRQAITPDRLLGRMNASMRFLVWGTIPAGSLIGGFLGDNLGLQTTMIIGVVGGAFSFLWVALSPVRALRDQPTPITEAEPVEALAS